MSSGTYLGIFLLIPVLLMNGCAHAQRDASAQEKNVGMAEMASDGTITLHLRTEGKPDLGDGLLVYREDDPNYKKILNHLGGMRPGEIKYVKPWPEKEGDS